MTLLDPEYLPTKSYAFSKLRHQQAHLAIQEGVFAAGDFKVAQRGAGANMSVDVPAGAAYVQGDDTTRQGLYHLVNDATINASVAASHATLPRIDQVIARVYDSSVLGSSDTPTIEVIAGTATGGATLDNRTGAAALPNGAIRLADVLVPAASTSVVTANIRDRRPWARGGFVRGVRTAGDSTISGTLSWPEFQLRLETGANPVRLVTAFSATGVGIFYKSTFSIDGIDVAAEVSNMQGTVGVGLVTQWIAAPGAGSHLFAHRHQATSGSVLLYANTSQPAQMWVEELLRQNAPNS